MYRRVYKCEESANGHCDPCMGIDQCIQYRVVYEDEETVGFNNVDLTLDQRIDELTRALQEH